MIFNTLLRKKQELFLGFVIHQQNMEADGTALWPADYSPEDTNCTCYKCRQIVLIKDKVKGLEAKLSASPLIREDGELLVKPIKGLLSQQKTKHRG